MRKSVFLLISVVLFLQGCEETGPIHVISVSPNNDVKINAGREITKSGFLGGAKKYDIFNQDDMSVARIVITQTFPDYSIGTITTRLDGSGVRPSPKVITEGMLCIRTTNETLQSEKQIYRNQKKAFKQQYKLTKMRAKSGVFTSMEQTVQDANEIDSVDYSETNGVTSESISIKKK